MQLVKTDSQTWAAKVVFVCIVLAFLVVVYAVCAGCAHIDQELLQ